MASPMSASTGSASAAHCATMASDGSEISSPASPTMRSRQVNARHTRARTSGKASGAISAVSRPNPAAASPNTCSSVDDVDR